jgi:hypothetical protein
MLLILKETNRLHQSKSLHEEDYGCNDFIATYKVDFL